MVALCGDADLSLAGWLLTEIDLLSWTSEKEVRWKMKGDASGPGEGRTAAKTPGHYRFQADPQPFQAAFRLVLKRRRKETPLASLF